MLIRSSILAGEILSILENVKGSVRINDIETILQMTKSDIHLAIARLLSEGLIVLIRENERSAIALTKRDEMSQNSYFANNILELLGTGA